MYILLILLGAVLIGLNLKAIKSENNSFDKALKTADENTTDMDEKLMEMRSEFAATITELQREISNLKEKNVDLIENTKYNRKKEEFLENNTYTEKNEYMDLLINSISKVQDTVDIKGEETEVKNDNFIEENKEDEIKENVNSLKVDEVKELLLQGIEEDEIAQRLSIGKGEVLLIKELYLR